MRPAGRASRVGAWRRPGHGVSLVSLVIALALTSGCASVGLQPASRSPHDDAQAACLAFLRAADELTAEQAVADVMHTRVPGFPFLRVSRFLASYAREVVLPAQRQFWLEQMRALDEEARTFEIRNLDERARAALQTRTNGAISAQVRACGRQLVTGTANDTEAMTRLLDVLMVPDDYSMLMRTLGIYPLTRWPFLYGIRGWQAETRRTYARQPMPATDDGRELAYWPSEAGTTHSASPASVSPTMARANPLSIPLPEAGHLAALIRRHAPVIVIEQRSRADQPGMPVWRMPTAGQPSVWPDVDESQPVMTVRVGHTRVQGVALLQLIYTVWFSARPVTGPFDVLGGAIDGLTWRVTLDTHGKAWAYDSIHPCGCYHLFFPGPRARARTDALAPGIEEGLFLLESVPELSEGQRLQIRLASATHYIQSVQVLADRKPPSAATTLQLIDENRLRSLPLADSRARSWYGPDGLVAGTERGERFFFWPMGIQSAGAMRQAGRQATAFVGRRHFDDADLFDRYFEWPRPLSPAQ